MKLWIVATVLALSGQANALSFPPMTNLQVACYGNDNAVVAHVTDAHLYDCEKRDPKCFPRYLSATLVVDEVLEPSFDGVRIGETIQVSFTATQPLRPQDSERSGSLLFPRDATVSDNFVKAQLIGKSLVLSFVSKGRSLTLGIPPTVDSPLYAQAYTIDEAAWLRQVWTSSECAKEREDAENIRRNRAAKSGTN